MHTFGETGAGVPAFLAKLWRLVEDPETNNLICWSKDGRSFIIQNQAQFARELLPLNYKHNNMASFIRQLNMYGFHKITSIDNGGLKFDRDEMEFTHPCFKRNCPYLLEHIKRKIASTKAVDEKSAVRPEAVTKVLQDVKAMRGRQDSLDSRFSVMKQENEALWREIASLRQKHAKQQQIVNKLIQFLITIVQPQRNMTSVKRHIQLMINDKPGKSKIRNTSESESECGPVIHELGEELMDEVSEVEPESAMANSPFSRVATPSTSNSDYDAKHSPHNIERPLSSVSAMSQNFDFSNQSTEDSVANAADGVNVGFVSTVSNDGSEIFYHITEVPDAQPQEVNASPVSYNEDDVLTTPMVREEMARSQLLKQTNRQRRNKNSGSVEKRVKETGPTSSKVQRLQLLKQQPDITQEIPQPMSIKAEQDTAGADPMLFLNVYPNDRGLTRSPNFSEDLLQSSAGNILDSCITLPKNATPPPVDNEFLRSNSSDLYNANSFMVNDIPADIFEDNSCASVEESSNIGGNDNLKGGQQEQLDNNRTFSTYLLGGNGSLQPSTSAAAAAANASTENGNKKKNDFQKPSPQSKRQNENANNLTLAKYKNNQEFMPLSTADDVSGHIDNVQDELEDLKDLLRSGYALDNNTLLGMSLNQINSVQNVKCNNNENYKQQLYLPPAMEEDILNKLFSDADILGSYGLHLSSNTEGGGNNNKKDSELTCPPIMYDLSEMINDQDDLDADVNMPTTSTLSNPQQSKQEFNNSVLNTPYHE